MRRPLRRELVFQLVETARQLRTHVDQRARRRGTTRAQWGVLARLRRIEGLNQAALAEMLEMQPITVTRMIDRLEQQGLVERRADPVDRRARQLYLTGEGRVLVDGLDDLRQEIAEHLLADVDEDALATTLKTLATVRERARQASLQSTASETAA